MNINTTSKGLCLGSAVSSPSRISGAAQTKIEIGVFYPYRSWHQVTKDFQVSFFLRMAQTVLSHDVLPSVSP